MQASGRAASWLRRRRWWVIAALVVVFLAETKDKPQWYVDEAEAMEEVAALLDAPVPYERNGEGWFWAQHVSRVVLPRVELDHERTRRPSATVTCQSTSFARTAARTQ